MGNPKPTMSTEMGNTPHLPEEILLEIFSRLPTKAAARCRTLSTTWRAHLSNSKFAVSHFTHLKETATGLILITIQSLDQDADDEGSRSFLVYTIPQHNNLLSTKQIQLPTTPRYRIAGSCNGLVLLVDFPDKSLLLLNPLSLHMVNIPLSGCDSDNNNNWMGKHYSYGLGYDSATHDFKIAKFSSLGLTDKVVDVYSMKTGVWKSIIAPSHYSPPLDEIYSGVFMNGAIHWFCRTSPDNGYVIGAFDLTAEVFSHEFRAPCEFFMPFVCRGCLCVIPNDWGNNTRDIWMMKKYGMDESWTKITRFYSRCIPLFPIGDNKILFSANGTECNEYYNLEEGVLETMGVNGHVSGWIYDGATFVHSLFSPNHQHDGSI